MRSKMEDTEWSTKEGVKTATRRECRSLYQATSLRPQDFKNDKQTQFQNQQNYAK